MTSLESKMTSFLQKKFLILTINENVKQFSRNIAVHVIKQGTLCRMAFKEDQGKENNTMMLL